MEYRGGVLTGCVKPLPTWYFQPPVNGSEAGNCEELISPASQERMTESIYLPCALSLTLFPSLSLLLSLSLSFALFPLSLPNQN